MAGVTVEFPTETGARVATQGEAEVLLLLRQPHGPSRRWCDQGGKALGEDLPHTGSIVAEELADMQAEAHAELSPGQIGNRTLIATVNARGRVLAGRAGAAGSHGLKLNSYRMRLAVERQSRDLETGSQG